MKEYKNRDWLYQKYIEEKLSTGRIAKLYQFKKCVIWRWLKKHNIPIRKYGEDRVGSLNHAYGKKITHGFKAGNIPHNKGKSGIYHHPEKIKKQIALMKLGKPGSPAWNKGKPESIWNYGLTKDSDERLKNHSQKMKEWKDNPFRRDKAGFKNPMWNGGTSFEPYGLEFNKMLKNMVRNRDGFFCRLCKAPENKRINGRLHNIHHIDYDKKNNSLDNLIMLCLKCHPKTNTNRPYWKKYFQSLISGEFISHSF